MRPRPEILRDLIRLAAPVVSIQAELAGYPWDSSNALVTMQSTNVVEILRRFLEGKISSAEVEEWANAVEMREDIECSDELVKEAVFELANPTLQGSLNAENATRWIDVLSAGVRSRVKT